MGGIIEIAPLLYNADMTKQTGIRDHFLSANGLRFHYLDWDGDGPDLLLVHPTGFVANIWQPLAERVRGRFHAVALDTRGHGDTDKPATEYGIDRLAADLQAFIEAAELDRPVGIGHSAGATTIAALEAGRPGTFRCAVFLDPVLSFDPTAPPRTPGNDVLAVSTLKRRAIWPSRQEVYDSYRSRPPFETWDDQILRLYVEHGFADRPDGSVELKCSPETESLMYVKGSHGWPADQMMPHVRCPVLLVRGEESEVLSAADAERTASLLADCRLVAIPGGHFAPFEHPRLAEDEVLRFLSERAIERPARRSHGD